MSVEVPDRIAKQFTPYVVISSTQLMDKIENFDFENESYEDRVLNFWAEWVPADEILDFIKSKK